MSENRRNQSGHYRHLRDDEYQRYRPYSTMRSPNRRSTPESPYRNQRALVERRNNRSPSSRVIRHPRFTRRDNYTLHTHNNRSSNQRRNEVASNEIAESGSYRDLSVRSHYSRHQNASGLPQHMRRSVSSRRSNERSSSRDSRHQDSPITSPQRRELSSQSTNERSSSR